MRRKRKQQKRLLEERLRDLHRLEAMEAVAQADGEGPGGTWLPSRRQAARVPAHAASAFCPSPQTPARG